MRLIAFAETPVQYHVDIYRGLGAALGGRFSAIFAGRGLAEPGQYEGMWGESIVHNTTGLLEGYAHCVLAETERDLWSIARRLQRLGLQRGDVVLMHTVLPATSKRVLLAAKTLGARVIYRGSSYLGPYEPALGNRLRGWRDAASLLPFSAFCCTGTVTWKFFERFAPGRPRYFAPYCADEFVIRSLQPSFDVARRAVRAELDIDDDTRLVVFLGRYTAIKNVRTLVRAFELLADMPVELVLAGDGPERAALDAILASDRWTRRPRNVGFLGREDVVRLLCASDVVALVSYYEPWSVVINEAIALDNALVVSPAVGSAADLVWENVNGAVVDPYSPEDIATGVRRALALVGTAACRRLNQSLSGVFSRTHAVDGIIAAAEGHATSGRLVPPGLDPDFDPRAQEL